MCILVSECMCERFQTSPNTIHAPSKLLAGQNGSNAKAAMLCGTTDATVMERRSRVAASSSYLL